MKISDVKAAGIAATYGVHTAGDARATRTHKTGKRADEATLSPAAQELLKARRAVQESPDVRAGLVAELRRQVRQGTYRVDDHALARRLSKALGNQ